MFTWEQNEIPNQGVVSNFQGLTYEIGPNPWGNFRLMHTEAHRMWWRPNLFRQCSLNSDACPPDATLATLLIQALLMDLLEGLEMILNALVEGGQMRFSGSVDGTGFGHRFVS